MCLRRKSLAGTHCLIQYAGLNVTYLYPQKFKRMQSTNKRDLWALMAWSMSYYPLHLLRGTQRMPIASVNTSMAQQRSHTADMTLKTEICLTQLKLHHGAVLVYVAARWAQKEPNAGSLCASALLASRLRVPDENGHDRYVLWSRKGFC